GAVLGRRITGLSKRIRSRRFATSMRLPSALIRPLTLRARVDLLSYSFRASKRPSTTATLDATEKNRNSGGGSNATLGALVTSGADARRWLRAPRVSGVLLSAVWLLLALHGLGDVAIVHSDESREVGIVQDVVAGHWLLPRFNDEMLPDKPILSHWLAA